MESQQNGTSVKELPRLSIKLLESHPADASEDILHAQNESANSDADAEFDRGPSMAVESFVGDDGQVYDLRKTRPLKIRNKKGQGESAARCTRSSWSWNNKGGKGADAIPDESLAISAQKVSCVRCGSDGHRWKRCHLPYQKNVAFHHIEGDYNTRHGKNNGQFARRHAHRCVVC